VAQAITVTIDARSAQLALARISAAQRQRARQWLREKGESIMTEAKEEVPVDLGTLRASGSVLSEAGGDQIILFFGGPSAPYALVQHERLDYQHREGTKAKFLEDPFRRLMANASAELAAALRTGR
jgi:hypothetical protein